MYTSIITFIIIVVVIMLLNSHYPVPELQPFVEVLKMCFHHYSKPKQV